MLWNLPIKCIVSEQPSCACVSCAFLALSWLLADVIAAAAGRC